MTQWQPNGGWETFEQHTDVETELWNALSAAQWHYLNFTSDSSAWENRVDGSVLVVMFDRGRIAELQADGDSAVAIASKVASQFGLQRVDD